MIGFPSNLKILVALEPCDMRKSFKGLVIIADSLKEQGLQSGTLFIFTIKRHIRPKFRNKKDRNQAPLVAPAPVSVLVGGLPAASLLAHLLVGKYGYLAYEGHHPEIVFMSCLAHIRRRFFEHHKIAKAAVKKEPKQTAALKHSWQILSLMSQLYRIESELRKSGAGPRLRQAIRSSQSRPIVKRLKAIFKILMARYRPSHLLREALKYALGQWTRFENYR